MNERIRKLRKVLDLTQQEFAERIGSKRNTIAKYETNANVPSAAVITLICREFNVNENWLRNGVGAMFNETRDSFIDRLCVEKGATELERQLLEAYFEIDVRIRGPFIEQLIKHIRTVDTLLPMSESGSSESLAHPIMSDEEIEAELEAYRQELLMERRVRSALPDGSASTA